MKINFSKLIAIILIQCLWVIPADSNYKANATLSPSLRLHDSQIIEAFKSRSDSYPQVSRINNNNLRENPYDKPLSKLEQNIIKTALFPLKALASIINYCLNIYFFIYPERSLINFIKNRFKRQISILDVGTGEGLFVEQFQRVLDKHKIPAVVLGIDINDKRIRKGRMKSRNLQVLDINRPGPEFKKQKFDIISINAPDLSARNLIAQSMKLLKSDGILILRLPRDYFEPEAKDKLISELKIKYNTRKMAWQFPDLPKGEWHRLYKPILLAHKIKIQSKQILGQDFSRRNYKVDRQREQFIAEIQSGKRESFAFNNLELSGVSLRNWGITELVARAI